MKLSLKNWLLIIKTNFTSIKQKGHLLFLFFICIETKAQIANYVNNGSFELCAYCTNTNAPVKAKYWDAIDTTKYVGVLASATISPYLVPLSSFTYQWPKSGNNFFLSTLIFKPNTAQTGRGYPRNVLKQPLQAGVTYCVKFYCCVTNQSTYGVDRIGAYFGDNTTDTISHCMTPISYLSPQIQNPTNNFITDTLNWIPITGTFVANGSEKYMILGNFKSDANTNTVMINPTNLPTVACDILYDDISCIPLNLPAYAGSDIWSIPTNTVYLGRQQDVGIDEACMWYKLPNTTTAIDTAAGITITVAATTETYMVKQDICGVIKYDTVVVHPSALGLNELKPTNIEIKIIPNPAKDYFELNIDNPGLRKDLRKIYIYSSLGQIIREEKIILNNNTCLVQTNDLPCGVYILLIDTGNSIISKKLIISK